MSKLSEEVEEVIQRAVGLGNAEVEKHGNTGLVDVDNTTIAQLPAFHGMKDYYRDQAVKQVRRGYREMAGGAPFETSGEAFERTCDPMIALLVPLVVECFADGIQMGQETSFPFKKYKMFKRLEEVFGASGWREESSLIALPIQQDPECFDLFKAYLVQTIGHLGSIGGYANAKGDFLNKIWDLWVLTVHSTTIGAYQAGLFLGRKWSETDALAGIQAASEKEES